MAEGSFTGIYKKPSDRHLVKLYRDARQELATSNMKNAKMILQTAIDYGQSHSLTSDVQTLQCIKHEIELYEQYGRSDEKNNDSNLSQVRSLDFAQVLGRSVQVWCEKWTQLPQSVFYIRANLDNDGQPPLFFVGRKHLSNLFVCNRIPELHCSQVRASMLLGLLHHTHASESMLRIHYYPLQPGEKRWLFDLIAQNPCQHNTELIYPFCLLNPSTHKELRSEPDGWLLSEDMAAELGEGETHLRDYTVKMLLLYKHHQQQSYVFYDPACSTGQFLAELKRHFPNAYTIGQDLSKSMIEFAQKNGNVDETVHADAALWPLADYRVDAAFVRFLNSEVVTTESALVIFDKIASRIKSNGTIIVFGHTPVLLASSDFLARGSLDLQQCVGATSDIETCLFQYYVLKVR